MNIISTLEVRNNRATATVSVTSLTLQEIRQSYTYGAWTVDVGGVIEGFYDNEFISFRLPNQLRCVDHTGFPVTKQWDLSDYATAEKMAYVYSKVIESRIRGKRAEEMAKVSILNGETNYPVTEVGPPVADFQTESGIEALPQDAEEHTFTLDTVFRVHPNKIEMEVTNSVDLNPNEITASVKSYDVETQALTVTLSAAPDTSNYVLAYVVSIV